jgi:hypothetical protein
MVAALLLPDIHSLEAAVQQVTTGAFNGCARSPPATTPPSPLSDGMPRRCVRARDGKPLLHEGPEQFDVDKSKNSLEGKGWKNEQV